MPNHLINETSPYLLQHAHNPVDWYPWGEEALTKALKEDKPILVSIGYAACHWCHVMERESFEDPATAELMNCQFINIKIDREERPDLDHIYMEAVQAISGSGGWPLNVFLTPDKKPFYGGTYFPPVALYNRASWTDTLKGVSDAFNERRHEIVAQAENLMGHIEASNQFGFTAPTGKAMTREELSDMLENILRTADKVNGGFGRAPKFPQTFTIRLLLQSYFFTKDEKALAQALLSLDKMIDGGINDQLGGGFARYSTDEIWLAPHFEKMLYDNALIVMALCEAYQVTADDKYLRSINETMTFAERELLSPEGGFYAALDADSEGVEGKYYTWSKKEIEEILGSDADLFNRYYNVSLNGNWEHVNILHVTMPLNDFAGTNNMEAKRLEEILRTCKEKLLLKRSQRVRPITDDKILLGWNAMMNTAYSKAFGATGNEKYRRLAVQNMAFILEKFCDGEEGKCFHTYKNGEAKFPAFLDDYANLIHALLNLQEITADTTYLEKVKTLVKWLITHFSEPETGYFYFTNDEQQDVIVRKKELYDGAVPSGNSLMAWNLHYCGVVFDNAEWRERAFKMCSGLKDVVQKYPGSFGIWAMVVQALSDGIPEIAVTGGGGDTFLKEILRIFIPFRILQSSPSEATGFPLLAEKSFSSAPMIYLCKDYACQTPVNEVPAFQKLLDGMYGKTVPGH
ncbi:MAG: thioredoxin domain-containing protein [Chitinophagaceae bacterium]|nr:thioredoxin domain-containing protein [Chitinophagaceae bacterium]